MIDMASIAAAVTGLKAATDLAKSFVDLKSAGEIQAKVAELQAVILSAQSSALAAQSEQFTLLDRVRNLEKHIASLEAWDAEKKRYELKAVGTVGVAYFMKAGAEDGEPPHALCAQCYQKGVKSFLQSNGARTWDDHSFDCPNCKTKFKFRRDAMAATLGIAPA